MDCQPHGLRKAAGRRLAEAGCTPHEIMAVLGHKTLAEAERYTRDADQAALGRCSDNKAGGTEEEQKLPKPHAQQVWENAEVERKIKMMRYGLALPRGTRTPVFAVRGRQIQYPKK